MTAIPLHIHEFSTGINPEGNHENWISRGFTGQYMNSTISEVPYNVERSIANDEFAVAESAVKEKPSMVGRVVLASGGSGDWSIVAVITRGKDEYVRSLTVARYFLAEGADSLSKIIAWLSFKESQGGLPIFNPFELKVIDKPNISVAPIAKTRATPEMIAWLAGSTPLILPSNQQKYPFPVVDMIAHEKAELTGQPVSWAFNVEALEKPERFQIILPASDRALDLIQKALATKPKDQAANAIDEKALKQAIKGLADNPTAKPEHCQTFVENIFVVFSTFPTADKARDYWQKLFDGQGASGALKQGIYTSQMVRLLTLRAIALPDTLPELLNWLQIDPNKKGKSGDYGEISLEFQEQLLDILKEPRLKTIFIETTRNLVAKVLTKSATPESVAWLFSSKRSLWGKYQTQLRTDLRHDLEVFGKQVRRVPTKEKFIVAGEGWNKIWEQMQPYWLGSPRYFDEKYLPVAELFDQLGDSLLASCFYQLSYGYISSKLFNQAFPNRQGAVSFNGLTIREQGYNERGERFIVPIPFVAAIAAITLLLGLGGGVLIERLLLAKPVVSKEQPPQSSNTSITPTTNKLSSPVSKSDPKPPSTSISISPKILESGLAKFDTTRNSISLIVRNIEDKQKTVPKLLIEDTLKTELGNMNLDFSAIEDESFSDKQKKEAWIKAVYKYQQRAGFGKDGVIDVNGKSYEKLEKAVTNGVEARSQPSTSPPENNPF